MSPEYAMNGVVSIKTDVFSFGVLILEILSGKKNNSRYHSDRPLNLIGYVSFPNVYESHSYLNQRLISLPKF